MAWRACTDLSVDRPASYSEWNGAKIVGVAKPIADFGGVWKKCEMEGRWVHRSFPCAPDDLPAWVVTRTLMIPATRSLFLESRHKTKFLCGGWCGDRNSAPTHTPPSRWRVVADKTYRTRTQKYYHSFGATIPSPTSLLSILTTHAEQQQQQQCCVWSLGGTKSLFCGHFLVVCDIKHRQQSIN